MNLALNNLQRLICHKTQTTNLFDPSGVKTPGLSGTGYDGNEEVLRIPQRSSITGTGLFSVISRTLVVFFFYSNAEKQSVYSTAPANWVNHKSWYAIKQKNQTKVIIYTQ